MFKMIKFIKLCLLSLITVCVHLITIYNVNMRTNKSNIILKCKEYFLIKK